MIEFKILKCNYYKKNLDYDYHLPQIEQGDRYINKDIANFIAHNSHINIIDINIISHNGELLVIIKYKI